MIGMDFPVKPEWIQAVLALWQPNQPFSELVKIALNQTMPELGGEKTRRNSLTIISRSFIPTTGSGQNRRTLGQNAWAASVQRYTLTSLVPAFLVQLIAQNEVALGATQLIVQRHQPGDSFKRDELRRQLIARFGERKVVTNSASAFLRTLQYFSVLDAGERLGVYRFARRLTVERDNFPLIVWALWQSHPTPQFELDAFAAHPALGLIEAGDFDSLWSAHQPSLWVISERLDTKIVTLKLTTPQDWETAL